MFGHFPGCASNIWPKASLSLCLHWGLFSLAKEKEFHCVCVCVCVSSLLSPLPAVRATNKKAKQSIANYFSIFWADLLKESSNLHIFKMLTAQLALLLEDVYWVFVYHFFSAHYSIFFCLFMRKIMNSCTVAWQNLQLTILSFYFVCLFSLSLFSHRNIHPFTFPLLLHLQLLSPSSFSSSCLWHLCQMQSSGGCWL